MALIAGAFSLVLAGIVAHELRAQEDIVRPPPETELETATSDAAPAEDDGFYRIPRLIRRTYGPVRLDPYLTYRFVHADGVQNTPGEQVTTSIHTVSPGINASIGEDWSIRYNPTWTIYSNDALRDTVGHTISVNGRISREDWALQLQHRTRITSTPLVETGQQTRFEVHSTRLAYLRRLGTKTDLEVGLAQALRYAEGFADSREIANDNWLHYRALDWATASIGFGHGYVDSDDMADATFQRYRAQIAADLGEKTKLKVHGGLEDRHFKADETADFSTPIYGADLTYNLTDTTRLTIRGDRSVGSSYFADQVTKSTRWQGAITQRFLGRYYLTVEGGRRTSKYQSTMQGASVQREDKGNTFGLKLGTNLRTRGRINLFFTRIKNESDQRMFAFDSTQYGFDFTYQF